jgi:hypothetical protein
VPTHGLRYRPFVFVFQDDIIIACEDFDKMVELIEEVASWLKRAWQTVSQEKSKFSAD